MMILTEKLGDRLKNTDEQAGFRRDRSTVQQILALRLIGEKLRRTRKFITASWTSKRLSTASIRM